MGAQHGPSPFSMGARRTLLTQQSRLAAAGFLQRQTRFYRAFSLAAGVPPARVPLLQNRCSKSLYTPAAYKIFCTPVFCCGARWNDAAAGRQAAADRMPSLLHRPPGQTLDGQLAAKMSALLRCLAGAGLLLFAAAGGAVGAVAAAAAGKAAVFADKGHRAGDAGQHQP